jgi:lysophospholipase L1-like esterase
MPTTTHKPVRLLIRGGSLAAGYGVATSYVDILHGRYGPWGVEVINRSHHRQTSFDGIDYFDSEIEPFRPDLLMIHFGIDDAFFPVYRSEFKENLVQIVRLARKRFAPLILLPTSHTFDNPYDMEAVNIYYRTIREVAVDLACELIPVHTYWAGYLVEHGLSNADLVQEDTRYPNEHGHAVVADALIQVLDRLIDSLPARV